MKKKGKGEMEGEKEENLDEMRNWLRISDITGTILKETKKKGEERKRREERKVSELKWRRRK